MTRKEQLDQIDHLAREALQLVTNLGGGKTAAIRVLAQAVQELVTLLRDLSR